MEKPIKSQSVGLSGLGGLIELYEDRIIYKPISFSGLFEIKIDDIESVTTEKHSLLGSRLKIYGHGTTLIDNVMKFNTGEDIKNFIMQEVMPLKKSKQPLGDYDELERLSDLKKKGIITQDEFDAKKKQILGL
jgi:hypothetical protein